ncbi:MAG: radical SAM protein [Thermoplasmatales archaeon]|nr:radical SAM protein [Thermoplasmatales archaeon]
MTYPLSTKASYQTITCKTLLHKINVRFLPFRWTINPYRGCEHSCVYCYGCYSHEYLGLNSDKDFEQIIMVKKNARDVLDAEFSRYWWRKPLVYVGSVTDPYQPAENIYEITRDILEIFLKYENPLIIGTKSNLILRDTDILENIARRTFLNVIITITTTDEELRKKIEPKSPSTGDRLDTIHKLSMAKVPVGVLFVPILPYLTDDEQAINDVMGSIAEAGADFVISSVLNLKKSCKERYFAFLKKEFPYLIEKYQELFSGAYAPKSYTNRIYKLASHAQKLYGMGDFRKYKNNKYYQTKLSVHGC